jgi:rhamnose utilization protein RhaD (predicted bifunctional aldolase and dehydrogenase)
MGLFFEKNAEILKNYVRLSNEPGARADYVQGGGGNTSCKFDDRMMAIKASGFKLSQITGDNAYAVLDYATVVDFYRNTDPTTLPDVEGTGSATARNAVLQIEGLPVLRPSVEAGFHSLLSRYVLHTHPVYANLATCSTEGRSIAAQALAGADYSYGFVPYIDPGAKLTFAIAAEQKRVQEETGRLPSAIFMQNHGLIATHDDLETCLAIHTDVNERIAGAFGVTAADFPTIALAEVRTGEKVLHRSESPWMREIAQDPAYDLQYFCSDSLYPDQMVFLAGNMAIVDDELPANPGEWAKNKCTIYRGSGAVIYDCSREEAQTIEETLVAVTFITKTIVRNGGHVVPMSDSGKDFIAGWESEKYRKSMVSGTNA